MALAPSLIQDLARVVSHPKQTRGEISVSGNAKVHLGDSYVFNKDLFEVENDKERSATLLNILHFDGEDAKRNQLVVSGPVEESLKWIKETSFMDWLRTPTPKPFWIQGKPASGKSTLMKHLSESKFTVDTINEESKNGTWTIVYFFFDYRAGTTAANNTLGMMKYFMKQLGDKLASVKNVMSALKTNEEDKYLDVLVETITRSDTRVCAFVDGLDEFEGDLWDLCLLLERLRTRTGMRMCLASRPEPAFEASYGKTGCPTITMQDHNAATIRTWLEYKVERFKADHIFAHELFTSDLLEEVVTKAQGVILWARLVMDEMVKSCHSNSIDTQAALRDILASLPPDLEPLYERILNKTNARYRPEIAWLLSLIDDVGGTYGRERRSPVLLCQALNYLQVVYLGETKLLPSNLAEDVYETRIKGLLGNLVDVELDPDMNTRKVEYPQIRLIHKSLSTYLERSMWIPKNVPESAKHLCTKPVWKRFTIDLLKHLSPSQPLDHKQLLSSSPGILRFLRKGLKGMCNDHEDHHVLLSQQYRPWFTLIVYLVWQFFSLGNQRGADEKGLTFPPTCEDFALLHYRACRGCEPFTYWGWFEESRILNLYSKGKLHLVLDLNHGRSGRLLEAINSEPEGPEMQDMLDLAVFKSSQSTSSQSLAPLLEAFNRRNCYLQPRHICMAPALFRTEHCSKILVEAAKKAPRRRAANVHDKDCPDRAQDVDFRRHWLSLNTVDNVIFLDFMTALNIDLDGAFQDEGGFYHGLLNFASPTDKTHTDKALDRFMAAAFRGKAPEPNLLQYARALRSKVSMPTWNGSQFLQMTTDVYIKFLEWVIVGVRYHIKFGRWHESWCRSVLVGISKVLIAGPFWPMEAELGGDSEPAPVAEELNKSAEKGKKRLRLTLRIGNKRKVKTQQGGSVPPPLPVVNLVNR